MPFQVGSFKSTPDAKKAALEALKAQAKSIPKAEDAVLIKYVSPAECPDRICIVFDDSGSMSWAFQDAKNGVVEFLRNCIPNQTAVAVHFMETSYGSQLESDLPKLGNTISELKLAGCSTPFFNTLKKALEVTPQCTRIVAFTDGSPTDELQSESSESGEMQGYWSRRAHSNWTSSANIIIQIAGASGTMIPIDTIFFGSINNTEEINLLKYLSNNTGGYFLHFDPKKVNFRTAFKYLAPVNRLQLTSGAFRESLERGEQK